MERQEHTPNQIYGSLQERIREAAKKSDGNNEGVKQRIEEFNYWPLKEMKIADLAPMEKFVRLVESVGRFQQADNKTKAKNALSYSVQLARELDSQLSGNDEAVKFCWEGNALLEEVNVELAEDISRIMTRVFDEKRFNPPLEEIQ